MDNHISYPHVVVMTLNWNNGQDLLECVSTLQRLTYPNYSLLVVDNGSTDGSLDAMRARWPQVEIIENGRNLGYAGGVNVGLERASDSGAAYCLVINSDTISDPEMLTELVKCAEQDDKIGLVTGKVFWHAQPEIIQTAGRYSDPLLLQGPHIGSGEADRGQFDQTQDLDYVDDVFLLVRRAVIERVGGYSLLFPVYWGISDLCARVRRAGFRIVYAPGARIWHKGVIGNENVTLSPERIFYIHFHQIPFLRRNASRQQWLGYWRRTLLGLPLQSLRYLKHGRFAALWAHLRGIGCGLLWLLQHPGRTTV